MEVSVSLEFSVDGSVDHRVEIVPQEHQVSGINEVDEEAKASNTSFDYSGRHDGGALPKLREGGPHDRMLFAIQAAKKASDEYTTKLIANANGTMEKHMDTVDVEAENDSDEGEQEGLTVSNSASTPSDRKKQQKGTPDAAAEKTKKARVDDA